MNRNPFFAALAAITLLAGCALAPPPAVGEWTGTLTAAPQGGAMSGLATGMLTMAGGGNVDLTLKADGTGYVKAMSAPERPITWKADGDRVLIYGASGATAAAPGEGIVARLSGDKKTLALDFGPVKSDLHKKNK